MLGYDGWLSSFATSVCTPFSHITHIVRVVDGDVEGNFEFLKLLRYKNDMPQNVHIHVTHPSKASLADAYVHMCGRAGVDTLGEDRSAHEKTEGKMEEVSTPSYREPLASPHRIVCFLGCTLSHLVSFKKCISRCLYGVRCECTLPSVWPG